MKERFLRQYSVDNYVIDFYCPKLKLAVEIDGDVHEHEDQKFMIKKDKNTLKTLALGLSELKMKNSLAIQTNPLKN